MSASKLHDPASVGIVGMRERILAMKGELDIQSAPQKGTNVSVVIPYGWESGVSGS